MTVPFANFLSSVPAALGFARVLIGCLALLGSLSAAAQSADNQPPAVPDGLSATPSTGGEIRLSWNASGDNVGVTQYAIYRNGVLINAPAVVPAGTACTWDLVNPNYKCYWQAGEATYTYTDAMLDPATAYSYSVAACDAAANCSVQSTSASASTPPWTTVPTPPPWLSVPPTSPLLRAAAVSNSEIRLYFYATIAGTQQVKIYRDGTLLSSLSRPFSGLPVSDTTVAAATTYSYRVAACDAMDNCSAQSPALSVTTPSASSQPDVDVPTVPSGLAASSNSSSGVYVYWIASSDNVGVSAYQVLRDGVLRASVPSPLTIFHDSGLSAATTYSYQVAACDLAGNCSAPSAPAAAATQNAFTPSLVAGWNLLGYSVGTWIDVPTVFGDPIMPVAGISASVSSVWKWNAASSRWAFYSPRFTYPANVSYAAARGYELLSTIATGEGYWVNAINPIALPLQSGGKFNWSSDASLYSHSFKALPAGFSLIATADDVPPALFNKLVSPAPPSSGEIPTGNLTTLWAWDAPKSMWYFYAPSLEANGGQAAVKSYADARGYLHFEDYGKTLGIGTGFWVNKDKDSPRSIQFSTVAAGAISGVTSAQNVVIRDASAWASLWTAHTSNMIPSQQLPGVDFSTQMVLGVFLGARSNGCYSIQILQVDSVASKTTVTYSENVPTAEANCPQVISYPYHLVAVPISSDTVDFIKLVQ